jgi:hypothetical protein
MEFVTMAEAAQRMGVSVATVKRRVRRGELKGQREPRPQGFTWMVEMPEVQEQFKTRTMTGTRTPTSTGTTDGSSTEVRRLEEMVSLLQSELEATRKESRQQLDIKDQQIQQLHILLQQAQAALPAPRDNRSWWRFWR